MRWNCRSGALPLAVSIALTLSACSTSGDPGLAVDLSDGCERIGGAIPDPRLYDGQDARAAAAELIGSLAAADAQRAKRQDCAARQRARYREGR